MCKYMIKHTEVYKYIMPVITSNMYIIIREDHALIVDPNENENAVELLKESGVKDITIILTHEHFDHISGVNFFRRQWECTVYANNHCKEMTTDPNKNLSAFFMAMFIDKTEEERKKVHEMFQDDYSCRVDVGFDKECNMEWHGLSVKMIETPGHSPGSICILINDEYLFSGDSLVDGNRVITRLPGGSRKYYNEITRPLLESLSEDIIVFPGHGTEGYLKEFELG